VRGRRIAQRYEPPRSGEEATCLSQFLRNDGYNGDIRRKGAIRCCALHGATRVVSKGLKTVTTLSIALHVLPANRHFLESRRADLRTADLRSPVTSLLARVLGRPNMSGNCAYLCGFQHFRRKVCPLRTSPYQPGCSTVAVHEWPATRARDEVFRRRPGDDESGRRVVGRISAWTSRGAYRRPVWSL